MQQVRAKFRVCEVTNTVDGSKIKLDPVIGGSEENDKFFNYTPYGQIELGTVNKDASSQFEPGDEFYVDFTKA